MNEAKDSHYHPIPNRSGRNSHPRDDSRRRRVRGPAHSENRSTEAHSPEPGRSPGPKQPDAATQDPVGSNVVFVNLPFHPSYQSTLVEIVTGCVAYGLVPRIVTQQPGPHRLKRLIDLIEECVFSIHDLSYLKRDRGPNGESPVPRLNMSFELGLVLRDARDPRLIVLERQRYATMRALSDVNGLDCRFYAKPGDILAAIGDSLFLLAAPDPQLMRRLHEHVIKAARQILRDHEELFGAYAFHRLILAAQRGLFALQFTQGA